MKSEDKNIKQIVVDACAIIMPAVIKTLGEAITKNKLNGLDNFNFLMSVLGSLQSTILSGVGPETARDHMALLSAMAVLRNHHTQVQDFMTVEKETMTPTSQDTFQ